MSVEWTRSSMLSRVKCGMWRLATLTCDPPASRWKRKKNPILKKNWHWYIEDGCSSTSFQLILEEFNDAASGQRRFGRLDAHLPMPRIIFRLSSSPSHQRWIARNPGTTARAVIPFVASSFLLLFPLPPSCITWKNVHKQIGCFGLSPWTGYLDLPELLFFLSTLLSLSPSFFFFFNSFSHFSTADFC